MMKVFHLDWVDREIVLSLHAPDAHGGLPAIAAEHWAAKRYALVAEVATASSNPEAAWNATNTVDVPWWKNAGVTPRFRRSIGGCRSTSIGDIVELADGRRFVAAMAGFEPVPATNPDARVKVVEL